MITTQGSSAFLNSYLRKSHSLFLFAYLFIAITFYFYQSPTKLKIFSWCYLPTLQLLVLFPQNHSLFFQLFSQVFGSLFLNVGLRLFYLDLTTLDSILYMFCYGRCGFTIKPSNRQVTPSSPAISHPIPLPPLPLPHRHTPVV